MTKFCLNFLIKCGIIVLFLYVKCTLKITHHKDITIQYNFVCKLVYKYIQAVFIIFLFSDNRGSLNHTTVLNEQHSSHKTCLLHPLICLFMHFIIQYARIYISIKQDKYIRHFDWKNYCIIAFKFGYYSRMFRTASIVQA